MSDDSFIVALMARGLSADFAQRIAGHFGDWEVLGTASSEVLAKHFSPAEQDEIRKARGRRQIPRATVKRLVDECEFRCCLCWDLDRETGAIIHHIRPHAVAPDDRYENLVILCPDHHARVHTSWELARHPYPPELLLRRKVDFAAAIAAFRAGTRVAPGREKNAESGVTTAPPQPPAHFTGREVLMRQIAERLNSQNRRAAVVGMGGVGKTAVALKIATAYRESFPGGILWTQLAADFGGIAEILRRWIRSLGHDVTGLEIEEQLALFADLVTKRVATSGGMLLLIDDVDERVLPDLIRLISYVPPKASVLLTTRDAGVGAGLDATQFRVEPLERAHCRGLLETLSGSAFVRAEGNAVDTLLSLLGDLPLAVELVARQIAVREGKPGFTIAGLCRRLEEFDPHLLSFPGHRGIALSFALSYENLDEREQCCFRSFGVFASGPLYSNDVGAVIGAAEEEAAATLDRLVTVSMLNWGNSPGDYRLHPLLHKYAEFLFARADGSEQESARARFYKHFASAAAMIATRDSDDLPAMDRIFSNLVKAVRYASGARDHSAVCEIVITLCAEMEFFTLRNLERDSMPLLELAISAARHLGDLDAEAASVGHLGTACNRLGMVRDAIRHYERAISLSRKSGNDHDLASHLQNLGSTLLSEAKDLRRAERLLHEGLKTAQKAQNSDALIGCLSTLGWLHQETGRLEEAARLYAGALEASRLVGKRLSEGNSLSNLGLVNDQLGRTAEGEKMIREALAIAVEIGDRRGEGNRTGHLGGILVAKAKRLPAGPERYGLVESAREYIAQALRLAVETGDAEKAATWLMNLGNVDALGGNHGGSVQRYEEALAQARAGDFARVEAQARFNLGSAFARLGRLETARDHFRAASVLLRKMGSPMVDEADAYLHRLNAMLSK